MCLWVPAHMIAQIAQNLVELRVLQPSAIQVKNIAFFGKQLGESWVIGTEAFVQSCPVCSLCLRTEQVGTYLAIVPGVPLESSTYLSRPITNLEVLQTK